MRDKYYNILIRVIYIIALCFIIAASYKFIINRLNDPKKIEYILVNEQLDLDKLIARNIFIKDNSLKIEPEKKYKVIFVISSAMCTICTKQFELYNRYFTDVKYINDYEQLIAVTDTNKEQSLWYAKVNMFKGNSLSVQNNADISIFQAYGNEGALFDKQLLLFDNNKKRIVCRIKVETGVSVPSEEVEKQIPAILEKAFNQTAKL
jgi:hypothetical protein